MRSKLHYTICFALSLSLSCSRCSYFSPFTCPELNFPCGIKKKEVQILKENHFISTAYWLTQPNCSHQGAAVAVLDAPPPHTIFRVLICPTCIIIYSLLAAVTLQKMTDVDKLCHRLASLSLSCERCTKPTHRKK